MKRPIKYGITLILCFIALSALSGACASSLPSKNSETINRRILLSIGKTPGNEAKNQEPEKEASFTLPAGLITIEDGAFEGTSLTTVKLPDSLESIGDYAFANIPTLETIHIPNATSFIGENAFVGSNQVTITAAPKSFAIAWAKEKGIPVSPITSFYAFNKTIQNNGTEHHRTELQKTITNEETKNENKQKPTGRMTGEMNADRAEEMSAFHILGRSPPAA